MYEQDKTAYFNHPLIDGIRLNFYKEVQSKKCYDYNESP